MILIYTDIGHLEVHAHAENTRERRLLGLFVKAYPNCKVKRNQGLRIGYASRITARIADINAFCADQEKKLPRRNRNYQGEGLAS
jgi:hypothetical protein